jgi:hypothetical protein
VAWVKKGETPVVQCTEQDSVNFIGWDEVLERQTIEIDRGVSGLGRIRAGKPRILKRRGENQQRGGIDKASPP